MKQVQDTSPILKDQKSGFIQYSGHEAEFHSGNINLYQMDCMELLKQTPDKYYELSIVDPPYGIDINMNMGKRKGKRDKHENKDWDNSIPPPSYFIELARVSKNQIIWGGNYFSLGATRGFIIWDKQQPEGVSFASCEFAWSSFDRSAKTFYLRPQGDDRIHPTQKPVALYKWILHNYAKPGDRILDTHGGSRSLAIACHQMGFDHVSCELDKDYHEASVKRFKEQTSQLSLL